MKSLKKLSVLSATLILVLLGSAFQKPEGGKVTDEASLKSMIKRYAPTQVTADTSKLPENDLKALYRIIEASRYMDRIFLRQVWSGNPALEKKLEADKSPLGRLRLEYFRINAGPWSRLDDNAPFIPGVPSKKPPQGSFYPDDMSRQEFESWVAGLPEADREKATGYFYVIRRGADHKLKPVAYSEEYREYLEPAARLLREAAQLTSNQTLKNFLSSRADAFASNDYYASDVAWMDLDSPIELTIGPYETYEDELFNYKAAFEAFVTLRDEAESARLAKFASYLQDIENNLPIDPSYRNPKLGAAAPIRVVDEVFVSGDANRGVQTAAFNLPNDERVIKEKGSKRVMIKNVQEAKFNRTLIPISKVVLDPSGQQALSFDAFFIHILAHELMHGLGPHNIRVGGKDTSVRLELKELYSALEEAKADITGLFALQFLIDRGVLDRQLETTMYTTYLASAFRSVRFGISEAHGKGVAVQFNYLMDRGAIRYDAAKGTFAIDQSKIKEAVRALTGEILTIEAEGSYQKAKAMLDGLGVVRPAMQQALGRLGNVPIDIRPQFPVAEAADRAR